MRDTASSFGTLYPKYKKDSEKLGGSPLKGKGIVGAEHTSALQFGTGGSGSAQPIEEARGSYSSLTTQRGCQENRDIPFQRSTAVSEETMSSNQTGKFKLDIRKKSLS